MTLQLTCDGDPVRAEAGATILQAALAAGRYIPSLCAHPDLPPQKGTPSSSAIFHGPRRIAHDVAAEGHDGCGLCVVEVEGEGRVAACATPARDGMRVTTAGKAIEAYRRERLAAIFAHHPHACLTCSLREGCTREPCSMNVPVRERCCSLLGRCELQAVAEHVGIDAATPRYVAGDEVRVTNEPLFDRDPALCIACGRCVRACSGRQVDALGWVRDAGGRRFVGPLAATPLDAGCRLCGSCVEVCPTGALMDRGIRPGDRASALVPCRAACPAGTDVPRYVRLVAEGQFVEAAAVVAERAPLVEVLGQVCFHPCESACRRNEVNAAPISICRVKREAGAAARAEWASRFPPPLAPTGRTAAVVGAGPAGLVAAHILRLSGHEVTLFEARPTIGGMLAYGIPPFRLSRDVVGRESAALVAGMTVRTNVRLGPEGTSVDQLRRTHDAVVVATGAALALRLDVPGEDRAEVVSGLSLLADLAGGTVPAGAYAGRTVVVVGGGNVAIDCARTALRLGASVVRLVALEDRDSMPAYPEEIAAAAGEGIVFEHGWGVREFVGNGAFQGVSLKRCTCVFDADGRFAPAYDEAVTRTLPADAAIVAIGQRADRSILPRSLDGVFPAGDLATGARSVVEAIASGREAALAADRFLGGAGSLTLHLTEAAGASILGRADGFRHRPRLSPDAADSGARLALTLVPPGLGVERARAEADRCLRCDLRLSYRPPVRPPSRHVRFAVAEPSAALVPEESGVLRFYDAGGEILEIVGGPDMRQEVTARLAAGRAATFDFEACGMYTQRQNELLSQFVEAYGRMPAGAGGDDDLF